MFITIPASDKHNKVTINTANIAYVRHDNEGIVHVVFANSMIVRLSVAEYEQYLMATIEGVTHVTPEPVQVEPVGDSPYMPELIGEYANAPEPMKLQVGDRVIIRNDYDMANGLIGRITAVKADEYKVEYGIEGELFDSVFSADDLELVDDNE